jgi:hypothetical protein
MKYGVADIEGVGAIRKNQALAYKEKVSETSNLAPFDGRKDPLSQGLAAKTQ